MGTFNVSLKTLTDRVSMEVVYTPKEPVSYTHLTLPTTSIV